MDKNDLKKSTYWDEEYFFLRILLEVHYDQKFAFTS